MPERHGIRWLSSSAHRPLSSRKAPSRRLAGLQHLGPVGGDRELWHGFTDSSLHPTASCTLARQQDSFFEIRPRRVPRVYTEPSHPPDRNSQVPSMCAETPCSASMQAQASHSALDELLGCPLERYSQSCVFEREPTSDTAGGRDIPHNTVAWDHHTHAPVSTAVWLPAPDFTCVSKQRHMHAAALRQPSWPSFTTGVAWVGTEAGAEVCRLMTSSKAEDPTQAAAAAEAAAAPAGSAAQGRKPKAAWRPCYQTVMKVCSLCTLNSSMLQQWPVTPLVYDASGLLAVLHSHRHPAARLSVVALVLNMLLSGVLTFAATASRGAHAGQDCRGRGPDGGCPSAHGRPEAVQCGSGEAQRPVGVFFVSSDVAHMRSIVAGIPARHDYKGLSRVRVRGRRS